MILNKTVINNVKDILKISLQQNNEQITMLTCNFIMSFLEYLEMIDYSLPAFPKTQEKKVHKQSPMSQDHILIKDWPKDEKHSWIASTTLRNMVAISEGIRKICKKSGQCFTANPEEMWDYFWKSPKGMHDRIKSKQKKVADLWKKDAKN